MNQHTKSKMDGGDGLALTTDAVPNTYDHEAIVRLRIALGLSQMDLANQTGVSQGYLSQLENGEILGWMSVGIAAKLASVLGISVCDFLAEVGLSNACSGRKNLAPTVEDVQRKYLYDVLRDVPKDRLKLLIDVLRTLTKGTA